MGGNESSIQTTGDHLIGDDISPVNYVRMNNDRFTENDSNQSFIPLSNQTPLIYPGFCSKWSISVSSGISPEPRIGHFTCFSKELNSAFIGYGTSHKGIGLTDLWSFDLKTYLWKKINLRGDVPEPKNGSRAIIYGTNLLIYGGFAEPDYLDEFHSIDLLTGNVSFIETQGEHPGPRSTPLLMIYKEKLYLWGGYSGKWVSTLHILDFQNMTWSSTDPGISGRTGIPTEIVGNKLFGYGCSRSGGFVVIDPQTETVSIVKADGTPPSPEIMNAGMVKVQQYLIYFGGKTTTDHTLIYACDTNRMWWFIFYVAPDGETTSLSDGNVSENGLFMIPKTHSFGLVYNEEKREIIAFLGYPISDPPVLSILSIGEALSIIHLRDDMISMLIQKN